MMCMRYDLNKLMKGLIPVILLLLFVPALWPYPADAAGRDVTDRFIGLLNLPEGWDGWSEGVFDDATLVDGLTSIYEGSIDGTIDVPMEYILYAMGETGLVEFLEPINDAIDTEPISACFALGKIPSVDAVHKLEDMLGHENRHVRDIAAYSLGKYPHYELFDGLQYEVLDALNARLEVEKEEWIKDDIDAAIVYIKTGVAINAAFEDE